MGDIGSSSVPPIIEKEDEPMTVPSPHEHEFLPPHLINLDTARQRFGTGKVNLLIELTHIGDPIADAVIKELEEHEPDMTHMFNRGIIYGLKTVEVDTPSPAVRAFLEATEALPTWLDPERLKRGSEAILSIGQVWTMFALGPGSLTHTYSSASVASILVRTGNLTKMAQRRILETGTWYIQSSLPGGLLRGAGGYIHNVQVRLLHARIRTTFLKRGWDTSMMGVPINQVEMVRTWLDFTYVPFRALRQFGITFTRAELGDLYHLWQYIAYLMGVDERFFRDITDQEHAQELLALIDSTTEGANEDSKELTQAMLRIVSELLQPTLKLPVTTIFDIVSAITRRLHGDQLADQLGVKRTWMSTLMPLISLGNRIKRAWDRRSATARRQAVARTVQAFQHPLIHGPTTYQYNASHPTQQDLPRTKEHDMEN